MTKLVVDVKELEGVGGTIYTKAPMIEQLMSGYREGKSKLAIVGMSCHIDAATTLQEHPAGVINIDGDAELLKIGLFCMKSFDYPKITEFLKDHDIEINDVERMVLASTNLNSRKNR